MHYVITYSYFHLGLPRLVDKRDREVIIKSENAVLGFKN